MVLVDCGGGRYPCKLTFGVDPDGKVTCKVSDGWVDLCIVQGVSLDDNVTFRVPEPSYNYVIYELKFKYQYAP
ncbi:hypothetical protein L195_g023657 [Trifolium pratense]|uniref:Uncharacterized protein n=1 Tax=Trifolium pratense TaxID=57577 RepID=A0A2K3NBG0_TRIPR|nr:hypothetical protein L195_g023657 [Trifolium pratense]